jgi:hypothetical protein
MAGPIGDLDVTVDDGDELPRHLADSGEHLAGRDAQHIGVPREDFQLLIGESAVEPDQAQ